MDEDEADVARGWSKGRAVGTSFRGAMMAPTWVRGRKGKLRAWPTTAFVTGARQLITFQERSSSAYTEGCT